MKLYYKKKRLLATQNLVAKSLILDAKTFLQLKIMVTIWLLNVSN